MSAGKGDGARPFSVSWDEFSNSYDLIFRKVPTCGQCGKVGDKCECAKTEGGRDE